MRPIWMRNGKKEPSPQICEWLLNHPEYTFWASEQSGVLWLRGKPGSSKSTLMNFAVEEQCVSCASNEDTVLRFKYSLP
jgi:hypothetical protein